MWKDKKIVPITIIQADPNTVGVVRTKEKDGYVAVQLGLLKKKKEFRVLDDAKLQKGDSVNVSIFQEGDLVRVSAYSKGRGFQGVVKRHGFHGGPKTHGQKNRLRAPGSIGSTAFQRVVPGRKMAGHMGPRRITIKNLLVANVDAEKNQLLLRGAIPGHTGSLVEIVKLKSRAAK